MCSRILQSNSCEPITPYREGSPLGCFIERVPRDSGLISHATLRASALRVEFDMSGQVHTNLYPAPIATAIMSDYEDDMEVDAPVDKESILFSSDNTNAKGKRSAANLPVEAEDSLPW